MRWQYRTVNLGSFSAAERLEAALGHLGRHGWELAGVYDKASNWWLGFEKGFLLFKRPVPEGEEPDGPWSEVWHADSLAYLDAPQPGGPDYVTPT